MRVSILGAGRVGAVTGACLASEGHDITIIDPDVDKIAAINEGRAPFVEPGLQDAISSAVALGRLRAFVTPNAASDSSLSLVCVATPSSEDGKIDLESLKAACRELGAVIGEKASRHCVLVRSTILPGMMRNELIPILERASGKKPGFDFGVGYFPEFMREGTAIADYYSPPKIVLGVLDESTADLLESLTTSLSAKCFRTTLEIAEMIKLADNSWHALKVAYANELGAISDACGVDSHAVMDIFCRDRKLNISAAYLRPGFAFGGSCLPKDLRALSHCARALGIDAPLIGSILPSNRAHIVRAVQRITAFNKTRVGMLGLAFKDKTGDLRESASVSVVKALVQKGHEVRAFDASIDASALKAADQQLSKILATRIEDILDWADVVVVSIKSKEFDGVLARLSDSQAFVDLA